MGDVLRWAACELPLEGDGAGSGESVLLLRLPAGAALVLEHQPLENFHMVGAGCLKLFTVDGEGFEQVTGFAQRGDVVGLDGCSTGHHVVGAQALVDTTVAVLARWSPLQALDASPSMLHLLQHATACELQRRTTAQYLMAPSNAEVRVARFLIHFGQRQHRMGFSEHRFRLPMCRRDLACYLGLAHETVSRSFTLLVRAGLVHVDDREVEILAMDRFAAMAHATRGRSTLAWLKKHARSPGPSGPGLVRAGRRNAVAVRVALGASA